MKDGGSSYRRLTAVLDGQEKPILEGERPKTKHQVVRTTIYGKENPKRSQDNVAREKESGVFGQSGEGARRRMEVKMPRIQGESPQ